MAYIGLQSFKSYETSFKARMRILINKIKDFQFQDQKNLVLYQIIVIQVKELTQIILGQVGLFSSQ